MQTTKLTNILLSNASHEGEGNCVSSPFKFSPFCRSENTVKPHNQVRCRPSRLPPSH